MNVGNYYLNYRLLNIQVLILRLIRIVASLGRQCNNTKNHNRDHCEHTKLDFTTQSQIEKNIEKDAEY